MFIFIDINECEIKGVCGVGGECTNEKLPYFLFKRRPQFFLTVY